MTIQTRSDSTMVHARPAGSLITTLAWVLAVGSIAFAVVNIVFETTGRFDDGPLQDYSAALSIVNWFVVVVKILGAAVALLSVAARPRLAPRLVNLSIWGAAWVLVIYALGSLGQAIGFAIDGTGSEINLAGVLYVGLFLLAAAGFGALAVSHTRRFALGIRFALLGSLGAVLVLGFILLILPAILTGVGIMPSS